MVSFRTIRAIARPNISTAKGSLARELVTSAAALASLESAWIDLLTASTTNDVFLSPQWLLPWWEVFGSHNGRALRVVLFRDGDRLVGLAPLLGRTSRGFAGIPRERLESLGSGEEEVDEVCSDYLGIIAERGCEQRVAESLAEALFNGELGAWDELLIPVMSREGPMTAQLIATMKARGFHVEAIAAEPSPHISLPATWEEYLTQLSTSRRAALRQSLRKFETWAGAPARIHIAATPAELESAMAVLHTLHRARWELSGQKGAFDSALFCTFHDRVAPIFLAMGGLQLGTLEARGVPVAAFYNLVWNNKSYFYQSGRTGDVPSSVRVGIVVQACLIRHAIESGLREYDFLPGASRYKMTLATATRPLVTLRIARPSLVESAQRVSARAIAVARVMHRKAKTLTASAARFRKQGERT